MDYKTMIVNKENGIAVITLNRPDKLNALSNEFFAELLDVVRNLGKDNSINAAVLTGGEKVFAAGADFGQVGPRGPVDVVTVDETPRQALRLLENIPKPVIAAVAGFAFGGGFELALVCDMRIAADNAKFGLPEIKLGLIPGFGGTQRLPRIVGTGLAKQMIFSGDPIDAQEALRIGLVNKVVPADRLIDEAKNLALKFASRGGIALRLAKSSINEGLHMDLEAGIQYEHKCFSLLFATEDQKEGMQAFIEKRKPSFKGR